MRLFFLASLILFTSNVFSQNKPDFDLIDSKTTNSGSPYYYPRLMDRYMKNDTTLNFDDYHHLYYGYVTHDNYKPLLKPNYVDSLNNIFSSRYAATGDETSKIEKYTNAILSVEPFNLRDINVLAYMYSMTEHNEAAAVQAYKFKMISKVIQSSGAGLTAADPIYVIHINHAEDLLNMMEFSPGKHIDISRDIVFISCKTASPKSVKGVYFNIASVYRRTDYLDESYKPKRKMEINPIPTN